MKVSIITASRNSEDFIKKTIDSVNIQTYQEIEHVFIDSQSSDRTLKIINDTSTRKNILISEKDAGIYDALNKGIINSSGDIVGFLHSDDFYSNKYCIEEIVKKFHENREAEMVYGDLNYISRYDEKKIVRKWVSGEFSRNKMKLGWMPPHPALFVKKELFLDLGLFDLNFEIASDYESIVRFLYHHKRKICYFPRSIINMRLGGASNSNLRNILTKMKEDLAVMMKYGLPYPITIIGKNLSKIKQFI